MLKTFFIYLLSMNFVWAENVDRKETLEEEQFGACSRPGDLLEHLAEDGHTGEILGISREEFYFRRTSENKFSVWPASDPTLRFQVTYFNNPHVTVRFWDMGLSRYINLGFDGSSIQQYCDPHRVSYPRHLRPGEFVPNCVVLSFPVPQSNGTMWVSVIKEALLSQNHGAPAA